MHLLTTNLSQALSFLDIKGQTPSHSTYSPSESSSFNGFRPDDVPPSDPVSVYDLEGDYFGWSYIIYEHFAQSSQMTRLSKCTGQDPILAIARDGRGFHGQHDHVWITGEGNLYISIYMPGLWLKNKLKLKKISIHEELSLTVADTDKRNIIDGFTSPRSTVRNYRFSLKNFGLVEEDSVNNYLIWGNGVINHDQDNITQSIPLLSFLQLWPCLAVFHAIQDLYHPDGLYIKPPNDIVIKRKSDIYKLAGCLTEIILSGDEIFSVRMGIGLNVNHSPEIPHDCGLPAISCRDLVPDHKPIACSIVLKKICQAY